MFGFIVHYEETQLKLAEFNNKNQLANDLVIHSLLRQKTKKSE